jgi:hypothetical protein
MCSGPNNGSKMAMVGITFQTYDSLDISTLQSCQYDIFVLHFRDIFFSFLGIGRTIGPGLANRTTPQCQR